MVCMSAGADTAPLEETTLSIDPTVQVDLVQKQREAERRAALQRAKDAAALPGAREREALVPEILLLRREVLPTLPVTAAQPEPSRQTWLVSAPVKPDLYAERVILRLLRAGFSSTKACAGEEWSGRHGENRVFVRVESRAVAIVLVPATAACLAPGNR